MSRVIHPDELPWIEFAAGARDKSMVHDERQLRLVEFASGFAENAWCGKAHIGYVIRGTLEVEFADDVERFSPGDILVIRPNDQHRARVIEGPVNLFLVEEPQG